MTKPKDPSSNTINFTVDELEASKVSIPSVTKLLNRKSLGKPSTEPDQKQEEVKSAQEPKEVSKVSIPSVTKLLNRKSLGKPSTEPDQKQEEVKSAQEPEVPKKAEDIHPELTQKPNPLPSEIVISPAESEMVLEIQSQKKPSQETNPSPIKTKTKKIQAAHRRERKIQKLIIWDVDKLQFSTDPLGKGIALALQKKATGALFLALKVENSKASSPKFVSTAAALGQSKIELWTGLTWDPAIVPEMWNQFIKMGYVELPPPGSFTQINSHRNIVRASFGVLQSEWLVLLRAGSSTQCRGIVAIITQESLENEIPKILEWVGSSSLS